MGRSPLTTTSFLDLTNQQSSFKNPPPSIPSPPQLNPYLYLARCRERHNDYLLFFFPFPPIYWSSPTEKWPPHRQPPRHRAPLLPSRMHTKPCGAGKRRRLFLGSVSRQRSRKGRAIRPQGTNVPHHRRTAGGARHYNPMESHLKHQIDRSLGSNHSPVNSVIGEAHLSRPQPAHSCRLEELSLAGYELVRGLCVGSQA